MLQAITKSKSNIYRRYLGHRDQDDSRRVAEEDELTALLIGPLEFFPKHLSGLFWGHLLSEMKAPKIPQGIPVSATIEFWPSRKIETNDSKIARIEPDLMVDLFWPKGEKRSLLIEMKWRARLSGEDQLHNQWTKFLSKDEQEKSFHLFIAPETSEALKARDLQDVWNGRLLAISWFDLLAVFHDIVNSNRNQFNDLIPWIINVISLMNKLGIRPFTGFNGLIQAGIINSCLHNKNIFWRGFDGFECLSEKSTDFFHYPIFFND